MSLEQFKNNVLPVKDKLFRFAYRLLNDEAEAKDVVQEVFIKVWNKRAGLNDLKNTEAWCMTLTKNLSYDKLKSKRVKTTDPLDGHHFQIETRNESPYKSTELKDAMGKINELMRGLPDKQRQVVHLRDVDGFSYKEICDIMKLDMNQVKINLFRARKSLRDNLLKINAYGI